MRNIFLILLFLSSSLLAELEWADDYKSALKMAQQEQKLVLVMFTKESCSLCEILEETLLTDPTVAPFLESKFVAVELDTEYDKRQGLKVYTTPTFYFLDAKGKPMTKRMEKSFTPEKFLKKLQETQVHK